MKRGLLPLGTLTWTLFFLALLVGANPFRRTAQVLDRIFGAAPAWTLVDKVFIDRRRRKRRMAKIQSLVSSGSPSVGASALPFVMCT